MRRSPLAGPAITPRATSGKFDLFVSSTGEDGGYYRAYVDDKIVLDNWTYAKELLGIVDADLSTPIRIRLCWNITAIPGGSEASLRHGSCPSRGLRPSGAKALAAKANVVLVAVGFDPESESEGADRTFRLPPGQDELIQEMAAANKNTIVSLTSGGGVDMNEWIDQRSGAVQAWYPGQEGGKAAAEILFGDVNPSGRLPATFERRWEDNPVHDSYYPAPEPIVSSTRKASSWAIAATKKTAPSLYFPSVTGFHTQHSSTRICHPARGPIEPRATDSPRRCFRFLST